MTFTRVTTLRSLPCSRAVQSATAPSRAQPMQKRYASSDGSSGGQQKSSVLPWVFGAVFVTIPSCWFLLPDTSHRSEQKEWAGVQQQKQTSSGSAAQSVKSGSEENRTEIAGAQGGGSRSGEDQDNSDVKGKKQKTKHESPYGQEIARGPVYAKNEQGGPARESASVSKEPQKGKSGEITGKQAGISTGPTKHSLPVDQDPRVSKKVTGGPESAKAMGTVPSGPPQQ